MLLNLHPQINIPSRQQHPRFAQMSKTTQLSQCELLQKLNLAMHLHLIRLQPKIIIIS